jgi:RNA polymerase sigma-70 factor (ECF subfamily)
VRRLLRRDQPGPYQLQAAINAVHSDPPPTDWRQVVALYDHLLAFTPTPVVRLNRAIALAETDGPQAALDAVNALEAALDGYHLLHATRAELLARLGRHAAAAHAYERAIAQTDNAAEQIFLTARRDALWPD